MDTSIVLISGIPGSGKSCFGRWLEREKGFIHLDVDDSSVLVRAGLAAEWIAMFAPGGSAASFVAALRKLKKPVVIDWGFPPNRLPVVAALKAAGVEIWWLDGDRQAARESFVKRGTSSVVDLDRQMPAIEGAWGEITRVFGSHIIETVKPGPEYTECAVIFARMFGSPQKAKTRKRASKTGDGR